MNPEKRISRVSPEKRIARIWRWYRRQPSGSLREAIVRHYWDLLEHQAKKLRKRLPASVEFDDLMMDGALGLLDAIDQFDPARAKFETFSPRRVRGAMLDGLRATDPVSRLTRQKMRKLDDAAGLIRATTGRHATPQDVARHLGVSLQTYSRHELQTREAVTRSLSGHRTYDPDGPHDLSPDALPDPRQPNPARAVLRGAVREILVAGLSRTERLVVILYYYEGMKMREIAEVLKLSESRVSQMHKSILARLRAQIPPALLMS